MNVWWQNFSGNRAGEVFIGTAHRGTQQLRAATGATGSAGIMVHGTFKIIKAALEYVGLAL